MTPASAPVARAPVLAKVYTVLIAAARCAAEDAAAADQADTPQPEGGQ